MAETVILTTTENYVIINDLELGKEYNVQVRAATRAGVGPVSLLFHYLHSANQ